MKISLQIIIVVSGLMHLCGAIFAANDVNKPTATGANTNTGVKIETGSKEKDIQEKLKTKTKTSTGSGIKGPKQVALESDESQSDESNNGEINKDKVQHEISSYILEAYKIQGNKILKDIDTSLQKINPEKDARIQSYDRIETTLVFRKRKILESSELSENNQDIIIHYLDFMIQSIEKRKNELAEIK